jgi:hypothetical protein
MTRMCGNLDFAAFLQHRADGIVHVFLGMDTGIRRQSWACRLLLLS